MSQLQSVPTVLDDNTRRFLDFLAKAEGADYNVITGGKRFNDFSQHPGVVGMVTKQGPSTAAGRYQITKSTYDDIAPKLGITDFSPESQDRIAVELIRRNKALQYVQDGDYQNAIKRLGGTWASLPSTIYAGHPHRSQSWVEKTLNAMIPSAQATSMANKNSQWEDVPVSKPNAASGAQWEDVPTTNTNVAPAAKTQWEDVPTRSQLPDIEVPAKKPMSRWDLLKQEGAKVLKRTDDLVRGAADALTFGYADEIAAKMDSLTGGGQTGKTNYDEALKAQRQIDKDASGFRTAGQVVGSFVPVVKGVQAAQGATRLARIGAGAGTGAIQGALYGSGSAEGDINDRIDGAIGGGMVGAAGGGILGGVLPATVRQTGNSIIKKAGDEASAKMDAEIIRDINRVAGNQTQRGAPVGATQLNSLENKYIGDVKTALKQVGQKTLDQTGLKADDIASAIRDRRIIGEDDLNALRSTKAGTALADAIEKAQRARSLTAPSPSSAGVMPLVREVNRWVLPERLSTPLNAVLGGRKTREVAASRLINPKMEAAAEDVLQRLGPSAATQSLDDLTALAQRAQANRQAMIAQQQAARTAALAQQAQNKNAVLNASRMPLGGSFQQLLPGGRSGLNLSSDQAIDALRLVSQLEKADPKNKLVSDAARQILRSGGDIADDSVFYGVQNTIRRLSEEGKIPGVSASGQGALSSGIRNPISYAANVNNAQEALKIARQSAPSPALAQFASSVGRIKSQGDKLQAIESRIATATDPAEIQFLETFVKPLANFGKK